MIILNRNFRITLLLLILVEELSFLGYLLPAANVIYFWLLVLAGLILAIWRLQWAVWLVLVELLIGSKGYLFFADIFGGRVSIRIALWSIVMLVWFIKTLAGLAREKNLIAASKNFFSSLKTGERRSLALLALFVVWGFINGLLITRNPLADVFLDFNGWLFFLFILPLSAVLRKREDLEKLLPLLLAAAVWLTFKTFIVAFIFSHASMDTAAFRLYRWIRVSGVGEITQVRGGFFRIFFQSQIYILIAYLLCVYAWAAKIINKPTQILRTRLIEIGLVLFLPVILLSLSRSFWLGLAAGLIAALIMLVKNFHFTAVLKKIIVLVPLWLAYTAISVSLIMAIVIFPVPKPLGGFDAGSLLSTRLDSNEAAVVSRWELLPKLWQKISAAPILGSGFGTSVTYHSSDPRQLQSPNKGEFTTYTFEWGWLDIWLKLGLVGFAVYLWLIYQLAVSTLKKQAADSAAPLFASGLFCALIALTVVHFFTPYLNHPLGIGFLIFIFALNQVEAEAN